MFIIKQALDDDIFSRITEASSSHQAWEILKHDFLGNNKVINVKLQTRCRDFETLAMKDKESLQAFLYTVSGIVNHMRSYGENISNETVVCEVLRSLTSKFEHIFADIEESKGMSTYPFDELMISLIAYEADLAYIMKRFRRKPFM